jgi:sec-independent protein translocase protein TatA
MMFIMVLALVLFGPKKLPEMGRTVGKAINEFRKASSDLKSTFEREMQNLEVEGQSVKEIAAPFQYDAYNYDYSESNPDYHGTYGSEDYSAESTSSTISASATEGADSTVAVNPEAPVVEGAAAEPGTPVQEQAGADSPMPADHTVSDTTEKHT